MKFKVIVNDVVYDVDVDVDKIVNVLMVLIFFGGGVGGLMKVFGGGVGKVGEGEVFVLLVGIVVKILVVEGDVVKVG